MPPREELPENHPLVTQKIPQILDLEQAHAQMERDGKSRQVVESIRAAVRVMEGIHRQIEEGTASFPGRYDGIATNMSLTIRTALTDRRLAELGIRSPLAFKWEEENTVGQGV